MQKCATLVELEKCCQTVLKRIFSCKISFSYSRERARQKLEKTIANFANFANPNRIEEKKRIDLVRVEVVPDGGRRGGPRGRELGPAPEARGPRVRRASQN